MPVCQVCGRAPAAQVALRRHIGMIVLQRFVRAKPTLCKEHGLQVSREFLNKTLIQGWWGIVSFFVNIFAVIQDLKAISTFKRLGEPQGAPASQPEGTRAFPAPPTGPAPTA